MNTEERIQKNPTLPEIVEYVNNKSVCLVGHASTIFKQKHDIDNFDIVCRCNEGFPDIYDKDFDKQKYVDYIGDRTDIMFLSVKGVREETIRNIIKPKYIVRWGGATNTYFTTPWLLEHEYHYPGYKWSWITNALNFGPTTGFLAIVFLMLATDFKDLTLFGFNFYQSENWDSIPGLGCHQPNKEKELVRLMMKHTKRIKIFMDPITEEDKNEVKLAFDKQKQMLERAKMKRINEYKKEIEGWHKEDKWTKERLKKLSNLKWGVFQNVGHSYHGHIRCDYLLNSGLDFETVLEIGTGNGDGVLKFLKAGKKARGIELSHSLFEECLYKKFPNNEVVEACVTNIPFPDNSFDVVCSFDVLEDLAEWQIEKAISEIYRVCGKYFYGSISEKKDADGLWHVTIKDRKWWEDKFVKAGFIPINKQLAPITNEMHYYEKRLKNE